MIIQLTNSTLREYLFTVTSVPNCPCPAHLCPSSPWRYYETGQLPCQNPGAPPSVFPRHIRFSNRQTVVWTVFSPQDHQLILSAFTNSPFSMYLYSRGAKSTLCISQITIAIVILDLFAKSLLWIKMQCVPSHSGLRFLLPLSSSYAPLFNLKYILLEVKDQNDMGFWELLTSSCPFLSFR